MKDGQQSKVLRWQDWKWHEENYETISLEKVYLSEEGSLRSWMRQQTKVWV